MQSRRITLLALCGVLLACACSVSAVDNCAVMSTTYIWTDPVSGQLRYTPTWVCFGGSCWNSYAFKPRMRTNFSFQPTIRSYCCYASGTVQATLTTFANSARTIPAGTKMLLVPVQCTCSNPPEERGGSIYGGSTRSCWEYN